MQEVDSKTKGRQSRYERGVRNPRPDLVARIRQILAAEPTISKSRLARRVGVSRSTVGYYLRRIGEIAAVGARSGSIGSEELLVDHRGLVDRIARAIDEVNEIVTQLRQQPMTPAIASAVFRGYATTERLARLLAELMGEISPPQQNVYLVQLQTLMKQTVPASELSEVARKAVGAEE